MSALAAGVELDHAIAERVMGWWPDNEGNNTPSHQQFFGGGIWWRRFGEPWRPSTKIAHAWEVVERLNKLGLRVGLNQDDGLLWTCWVGRKREVVATIGWHDTAPHAICLAALDAVGGGA